MIPEAAVEAAARGMFAEEQCDRRQKLDVESNWRGRLDDRDRAEYRRLTRAALEAAAPHLAPSNHGTPLTIDTEYALGCLREGSAVLDIHGDVHIKNGRWVNRYGGVHSAGNLIEFSAPLTVIHDEPAP